MRAAIYLGTQSLTVLTVLDNDLQCYTKVVLMAMSLMKFLVYYVTRNERFDSCSQLLRVFLAFCLQCNSFVITLTFLWYNTIFTSSNSPFVCERSIWVTLRVIFSICKALSCFSYLKLLYPFKHTRFKKLLNGFLIFS